MFRSTLAIDALFTRVGWQQPTSSDYAILSGDNLVSLSGNYFTDYHKAVTVKNIKETQEDSTISDADFNSMLERMQKGAINRVLNGVFKEDIIIEDTQLFVRENLRYSRELENTGLFVGIHLDVAPNPSYAVRINNLSLLFNGVVTFNMYCYHSAKGKIWTKSVTTLDGIETIVNITDLILSISEETYKGGEFYIGYFQDDLGSVKAIDYNNDEFVEGIIFCAEGFNAVKNGVESYDVQTLVETNLNYGINIELSSHRDFTGIIKRNPSAFDEAIGLQMAVDCVEMIINSTRSNMTERLTKEYVAQLYNDLNLEQGVENMPYTGGLKNRLQRELKRLHQNLFPKPTIKIC